MAAANARHGRAQAEGAPGTHRSASAASHVLAGALLLASNAIRPEMTRMLRREQGSLATVFGGSGFHRPPCRACPGTRRLAHPRGRAPSRSRRPSPADGQRRSDHGRTGEPAFSSNPRNARPRVLAAVVNLVGILAELRCPDLRGRARGRRACRSQRRACGGCQGVRARVRDRCFAEVDRALCAHQGRRRSGRAAGIPRLPSSCDLRSCSVRRINSLIGLRGWPRAVAVLAPDRRGPQQVPAGLRGRCGKGDCGSLCRPGKAGLYLRTRRT